MAVNADPPSESATNEFSLVMGDKSQNSKGEMSGVSMSFLHNERHLSSYLPKVAVNLDEKSVANKLDHVDLQFSNGTAPSVQQLINDSTLTQNIQPVLNLKDVLDKVDLHEGINSPTRGSNLDKFRSSSQSAGDEILKPSELQEKVFPTEFKNLYTDEQKIRDVRNAVQTLPDSGDKELHQKKLTSVQWNRENSGSRLIEKDMENVKLRNELAECQEREARLKRECERLRTHLLQTEDRYTREALEAEEREEDLRKSLTALRQEMISSSTDVLNAKSSASRQVESLRVQLNLVMEQRDDALQKLAAAEETISSYSSSLANLQMVLEQFQDGTRQTQSVELEICQKELEKERLVTQNLHAEKLELQKKLDETVVVANSVHQLKQQITENEKQIVLLQNKLQEKEEEFSEAKMELQRSSEMSEDRIDRLLVKNLLMGFIHSPLAKRAEAFTVVGHILGFTDAELESIGVSNSGSWLVGLSHNAVVKSPGTSAIGNSNHSFSELFIRFLENESAPLPQPKLPAERMVQEHQEKQKRLSSLSSFPLSPIASRLPSLSMPTTPNEKFAAYSHSNVSSIFPV